MVTFEPVSSDELAMLKQRVAIGDSIPGGYAFDPSWDPPFRRLVGVPLDPMRVSPEMQQHLDVDHPDPIWLSDPYFHPVTGEPQAFQFIGPQTKLGFTGVIPYGSYYADWSLVRHYMPADGLITTFQWLHTTGDSAAHSQRRYILRSDDDGEPVSIAYDSGIRIDKPAGAGTQINGLSIAVTKGEPLWIAVTSPSAPTDWSAPGAPIAISNNTNADTTSVIWEGGRHSDLRYVYYESTTLDDISQFRKDAWDVSGTSGYPLYALRIQQV